MNIQAAAHYLKIGYRIRRACWEPEEYLSECAFLEKTVVMEYSHFNPETRKFEEHRGITKEDMAPLEVNDLLADDWEVITIGLRKDFNKYGSPEYLDEPDWDNYVCKGWGDEEDE